MTKVMESQPIEQKPRFPLLAEDGDDSEPDTETT
jgi:hypothetical protein